jgi:uncharacterized protein (TIGR02246 family)
MLRSVAVVPILIGCLVIGACAPAAPPAPPKPAANAPEDIAAVNTARGAFATAYAAADAAAIGKLYTTDATSEPNGQPTLKGRDAIVASLAAMFQQVTVKAELKAESTVTLSGVAIDRGRYSVTVTPKTGGTGTTSEGRYLVVYVKEADGVWRVSHDIDNVDAIAAPRTPEAAPPVAK